MEKKRIVSEKVYKPDLPVSMGIKVTGGSLIFLSGQIPVDSKGELVGKDDVEAQCKQVFENMKAILKAAGATFDDIINITVYTSSIDYFPKIFDVRKQYFKGDCPPTSAGLVVSLAKKEWLVEIDAIAVIE